MLPCCNFEFSVGAVNACLRMTEVCKEERGTAERWSLRSGAVSVEILSLGCVIQSIRTPDHSGHRADIVLGYDHAEGKFQSMRNQSWKEFNYCEWQVFVADVLMIRDTWNDLLTCSNNFLPDVANNYYLISQLFFLNSN